MIISPGRKYVFVHIPKTGGTSLALALENRAMKDDILIGDTQKARRRRKRIRNVRTKGRLWKHSTLCDIDGLLPEEALAGLFAFTLVRNPWDRAVSYYHWLREQTFAHPAVELAARLEFAAFITHPHTMASLEATPARSYMLGADGVEKCDAYIRIENFPEDAAVLFRHLGFEFALTRENPSHRHADFRSYYSDETARVIARVCAQDIDRFGYTFDDPQ